MLGVLLQDPFLPSTCSPRNHTLPQCNPEQNWRQVLVQVCFPDCGRESSSLQCWLMLNISISIAVSALSRQQFRGNCAPLSIRAITSWWTQRGALQQGKHEMTRKASPYRQLPEKMHQVCKIVAQAVNTSENFANLWNWEGSAAWHRQPSQDSISSDKKSWAQLQPFSSVPDDRDKRH